MKSKNLEDAKYKYKPNSILEKSHPNLEIVNLHRDNKNYSVKRDIKKIQNKSRNDLNGSRCDDLNENRSKKQERNHRSYRYSRSDNDELKF